MNATREIIPGFKQPEVEFGPRAPQEIPVVIARLEKAMPELIHSTVALENNPMTFVEVKTMLDGVTVGGHKIEDSQQVLNQARSYKRLINRVRGQYFQPTQQELCGLHKVLAFEEALEWGAFRRGDVRIAGTGYRPPPAARLPGMYKTGMENIRKHVQGPHLQAMCAFLLVSKLQCFWENAFWANHPKCKKRLRGPSFEEWALEELQLAGAELGGGSGIRTHVGRIAPI